ncbi:hypothetical protein O3G_MSEX010844 [Manduca sexta]|uniref:BESS domain-containing protein n=2 Tax=Manduca sexta TaxID=7130 RepID=A0A921ZI04_MANSE|nr:hypothetical protein O3G_MSEX010844 [Manduca sexta]
MSKSGSNKKNISYLWSSQLSFLDNFKPPNTYLLPEPTASPSSSYIQPTREFELSQDFMPLSSNLSPLLTQLETPTPEIVNIASSSRSTCLNEEAPLRKRKRKVDHANKVPKHLNKKKRKVDGIDHLFLSYADTFKKFPPREQALLKLELAKLFSNTELKLLQHNSDESQASSPAHSNSSSVDNTTLQEIIENTKQPTEYFTEIKKEE